MTKRIHKIKKIVNIFITIFVCLLILMNFYLYYTRSVMNNRKASFLGVGSAIIISGSMEPKLHVNDLVLTMKSNYKVNDIIMFDDGEALVTHRIVNIYKDGNIQTKGDANNTADIKLIKRKNIVGKVIFRLPKVGQFVMYMQAPMGMMLIFVSFFLMLYYPLLLRKE